MAHIETARPNRAPGLMRNRIAATLAVLAAAMVLGSAPASASEPPPLTCIGGQSTGSTCICPSTTKKVQTGEFHFVCTMGNLVSKMPTANSARPAGLSGRPSPDSRPSYPEHVTCIGGKADFNVCLCSGGSTAVQTSPGHFVCTMDRLKATPLQVDAPPSSGVPLPPRGETTPPSQPPRLVCIGGKPAYNVCFCPAGSTKVQTGTNHFVCTKDGLAANTPQDRPAPPSSVPVPPSGKTTPQAQPPRLVCIGGKSTGTACFCPARTVKVQTGPNRFVCNMGSVATGALPGPVGQVRTLAPNTRPLGLATPNGYARPTVRPFQHQSAMGGRRPMR